MFTVMLVFGWSLTQSSETVYTTQTAGHHYQFEASFTAPRSERETGDALYYLGFEGTVLHDGDEIEQTVFGMDENDAMLALSDTDGAELGLPDAGNCYVSVGFSELYGVGAGQAVTFRTADGTQLTWTVEAVAYNAKTKTVIVPRERLAAELLLDAQSYNGVLSAQNLYPDADKVTDRAAREDALARDKVSNAASALICQSIGLVAGIVLTFLALFIAFQDGVKDMLIMDNLGYRRREIKRLLINVFLPILIIGFIVTAFPSVLIAKAVQISLARQMGDYMPFATNIWVLLVGFVAIIAVYWLTQLFFALGVKHITKKKGILEYTNSL